MDDLTERVADAARIATANLPDVELMYVANKDDDHPMRVRKAGTYRVVLSGWSPTLHRCALHRVVSPRGDKGDEVLRKDVADQLETLLRQQGSRARAGYRVAGLNKPVHRHPFEADGRDLDIRHILTDRATVSRLRHEEGDDEGVRRRLAQYVNRHLRNREGVERTTLSDVSMDRWVLDVALPLGPRATLQGDKLFLKDKLPETIGIALGSLEGLPLRTIIEAPGIDDMIIRQVADGRIFEGDARSYARECSSVVALMGVTPGRLADLIGKR